MSFETYVAVTKQNELIISAEFTKLNLQKKSISVHAHNTMQCGGKHMTSLHI